MKILYLDCYSGISGDMFLGALIDAGLDLAVLRRELSKLKLKGYRIEARSVKRGSLSATKFDVIVDKNARDKERNLKEITSLISRSGLAHDIKEKASAIFRRIAQAEAKIHGGSANSVHFHEVGDIDSIVDIVGAAVAVKALKISEIYSSPVSVGSGAVITVKGGAIPVPAPAALYMLKGMPLASSDIKAELVTPTGAALLAELADGFAQFPEMTLEEIGYGAGGRDIKERPNCLRAMIGEKKESFARDKICVIEANIDDMSPVDYEYVMERLFDEGALDAYLVPVQMKKTRPGILLTVLAEKKDLEKLSSVILSESTTIGVRYHEASRNKLYREIKRVRTKYGDIRVKISRGPGDIERIVPEYDDCKKISGSKKIPLAEVRKEAAKALIEHE